MQASQDSIGQRIPSLRPASGALGQPKPPSSAEKPKPLNAFKVTHAYNWVSASNGSAWAVTVAESDSRPLLLQDGAEASHLVLEEGDIVVRIYPKTAQTLGKFATLLLNLGA